MYKASGFELNIFPNRTVRFLNRIIIDKKYYTYT